MGSKRSNAERSEVENLIICNAENLNKARFVRCLSLGLPAGPLDIHMHLSKVHAVSS